MARYTYNESLVSQAIEDLSLSCKALDDTNSEMQKGINTVINARGAENIDVDFTFITNYQSQVIEYIEAMSKEISSKAQEIEEYQSAPWYKKLFATIGMGALKIFEGLGSFVENIGDGLVSIAGFVGGVFNSDFQNACAEFVKKDYVGDAFADAYENGWLKDVNKYSIMSHTSTAANVLKGIGNATGYIIVGVATGGTGFAALAPAAGVALVGGIGRGTQSGLQQGLDFNAAFGQGVKQGVTAAATTLVVGGLANKLGSLAKGANVADDLVNAADDLARAGDDIVGATGEVINSADDIVNASGEVINSADDIVSAGGELINSADDIAGAVDDVLVLDSSGNVIAKVGGASDDISSSSSTALATIDDASNLGSNALATIDDVANTTDDIIDVTYKVVDSSDEVASAATKSGILGKITNKVDNMVTNFGTNTKVGQGLANLAAKAGPQVTTGVAAGVGQITSGGITTPVQDVQFRVAANAEPSPGIELYEETTKTLGENIDALRNSVGETPTTSGNGTGTSSGGSSSSGYNSGYNGGYNSGSGGSSNYGGSSVTAPEFKPPEDSQTTINSPSNPLPSTPEPVPNNPTPNDPTPSNPNPPIEGGNSGGNDPIGGGTSLPGGSTGGNNGGGRPVVNPGGGNYGNLAGESSNASSDGIMNSLGNTTGSLNDIATSATNIPTSSSPILSSDGLTKKSASVIPITAGLGAAGLAGIGTKAYLDKREKKDEEEEDSIETEEWQEDADSMNIEYGETENADADYLTPTDEYAFQES